MKMFTVAVVLALSALANGQTASILPTNLTVIEGDDATFACSPFIQSSLPILQIRPDSGSPFENIDESDPRLTIVMDFEAPNDPTNRTYRYSNLQRGEDMTQFTCSVNGNEAMPPVTIRVYFPPTYTPPGVQVVEEGMDITVALTVEARPAALTSPTLARDGGATVASDTVVTAISVVFVDVQRADAALYTLRSTNDAGKGSVDFTLDVQYAPEFNVNFESENVAVGVGGTTNFRCYASGNPAPTVMFTAPSPDPHGASTIDSDGFITITDAADVPGPVTYMCVATNGISPADTLSYALYTGKVLPTVSNLVVDVDEDTGNVTLSWSFTVGDIPREFLYFQLVFDSRRAGSITLSVYAPASGTTINTTVQAISPFDLKERTRYTLTVTAGNPVGDGSQTAQQIFRTAGAGVISVSILSMLLMMLAALAL